MSDTKALNKVLEIVKRESPYITAEHMADILAIANEAAAELEELQTDNKNLSTLLAEKYEIYLQNCAKIDQQEVEIKRQKCEINELVATGLADDTYREALENAIKYISMGNSP